MIKRNVLGALTFVALLAFATGVSAQNDYALSAGDASGLNGDNVDVAITLDATAGDNVSGYSYSLCTADISVGLSTDVNQGADVAATNDGDGADFYAPQTDGAPFFLNGGMNIGVVISILGTDILGGGAGLHTDTVSYDLVGSPGSSTPLDFCSTLGSPAVVITIVTDGSDPDPDTEVDLNSGSLSILTCNFVILENAQGLLGGNIDVAVDLDNCDTVDALSLAIAYDSGVVTPTGGAASGAAAAAEFFSASSPAPGELIVGLVMEANGTPDVPSIPPNPGPSGQNVATLSFNGDAVGNTALTLTNGLGAPPIDNLVVVGGLPFPVETVDGSINVVNFNPFIRGDCNDDAQVNIADGIYLINDLFQGGPDPVCDDACDANDDAGTKGGGINLADATYIFNYRFLEGLPPPAPFPAAGIDGTTGDGVGCNGDADDTP